MPRKQDPENAGRDQQGTDRGRYPQRGAGQAFEGGWNKVKLYFMLGLPTETEEDILAIAELCEKVAERYYDIPKEQRNGKCQITASSSFFVPKPFTPFQWASMNTKEQFLEKARLLKESIRSQKIQKSIKYNYHEADVSVLEGVLARGDRRLGAVIEAATGMGLFLMPGRRLSVRNAGRKPSGIRGLILPSILPGSGIGGIIPLGFYSYRSNQSVSETGVGKRPGGKSDPQLPAAVFRLRGQNIRRRCLPVRLRIKFSKTGSMKFIGHLDVMRYFRRLCGEWGRTLLFPEASVPTCSCPLPAFGCGSGKLRRIL